jgi:hypothetical protein
MTPHYDDFTLTLSGTPGAYRVSARGEHGLVALDEPTDGVGLSDPLTSTALEAIRNGYAPGVAEMVAVGTALYQILFPPPIATLWDKVQAYADEQKRVLRLRLEVVADALAGLPWELVYDPQSQWFLMARLRFSLVRGIARAGVAVRPLRAEGQALILRLVSNPLDRAELMAGQGDWLTPLWQGRGAVATIHAVTAQELQSALLQHNPHILHFDGHGGWDEQKQDGYIVLEDGQGGSVEMDGATLFTLLDGTSVRLVVLAACKSGQGGAVKQLAGVAQRLMSGGALPAVVAMQYDVPDSAALRFAETFYQALAAGYPLDGAVTEGRKAVLLQRGDGDGAWATPVLYLRAAQGELFAEAKRTVPFQVGALSNSDIPRVALLATIRNLLVGPVTRQGQAVMIGVHGAGGYGKSSLVRTICHDPVVKAAFPDGVLWVQVGQNTATDERTWELALVGKVLNWVEALGGERGSVTDLPSATDRLNKALGERRCLLVVDNVWQRNDGTPFLQGVNCAKVMTARNANAFPPEASRVAIAGMTIAEGIALLTFGVPFTNGVPQGRMEQLVQRLGEYPLLLGLVNRTLVERVVAEQSPITEAFTYVEDALTQFGVTAFDDQERAVQAVLNISFDQLTADELKRLTEIALFPEDIAIPIAVVAKVWQGTGALSPIAADKLLSRLAQLSLLLSLDRRPEYKSLQLHDIVRARLLEPLDPATKQTMHGQIVTGLGAWQGWGKEDRYAWRWYSYHLQAAGRGTELYDIATNGEYRAKQRAVLGDIRVVLADIQRALMVTLAEEHIFRTIHLAHAYRQVAQTEHISDDVFFALEGYRWEDALQIAAYYGKPPRMLNSWVPILYLQIGWEAALAGAWQMAERATQTALAFQRSPTYPLHRFVETLLQRIAMTLGQAQMDGLDAGAWAVRLGISNIVPALHTLSDIEAMAQLERAAATVAHFRQGLAAGDAEAISSYNFADEEQTVGVSGYLSSELLQVAHRAEGQQLIQETLEAILLNKYPFYRDIALGALGQAVLAIPDGVRASELVRQMLTAALNDEGITFEWELPHQLMALAVSRGAYAPFALQQLLMAVYSTRDKWGTFFRMQSAVAAELYYKGNLPAASAILATLASEPPEAMYAGYSVLHLLMLHHRYLEFQLPPPAFLVAKAGIQATYVQDKFTLEPARVRLVQFAEQLYQQASVPTVAEVEGMLSEEEDVELQRFYCDYALSVWLAQQPPRLEAIKAMIPRLLEKHATTLDLYLARWVALEGNTIAQSEIESLLATLNQSMTMPPPGSEFG